MKHGAKVNLQSNFNVTALIYASVKGHEKIVELLLKHGADKTIKDKLNKIAYYYAKIQEIKDVLK